MDTARYLVPAIGNSHHMRLFFSVGEPSGDLHGANLIRSLRALDPSCAVCGYGGPRMATAGCEMLADLTQLAVMGFSQAVTNLPGFYRLFRKAERYLAEVRPDAVILIDYPGFNWWIARAAKKHGIPVFYYGVPQMWAWAGWRVRKLRRLVDHVLCKLPFEVDWFQQRGCAATYVGHPFFDELQQRRLDSRFLAGQQQQGGQLVTLLPGSRQQEVARNLPVFLDTAERIFKEVPTARFAIASYNEEHACTARRYLAENQLPIEVYSDRTPELIQAATCCLACSGSVSLELLFHLKPTVIHYRVPRFVKLVARHLLLQVKYFTLVNLLAAKDAFQSSHRGYHPTDPNAADVPFPEYLTDRGMSPQLAPHLIEWLTSPASLQAQHDRLARLKLEVAHGGASDRAATYILNQLASSQGDSRTRAA